jgi:hypothetical protein
MTKTMSTRRIARRWAKAAKTVIARRCHPYFHDEVKVSAAYDSVFPGFVYSMKL